MEDIVRFKGKKVYGIEITDELAHEMSTLGRTRVVTVADKLGHPYLAHLELHDGQIKAIAEAKYLRHRCPHCGGQIRITGKGYFCENSLKKQPTCKFHCNGILSHRFITPAEMEAFLDGHPTFIDGCSNSMGHIFSAVLAEDETYGVTLKSVVGKCPICGSDVLVSPLAFNCSSYQKFGEPYHFSLWRRIKGYELTLDDIHELLTDGITTKEVILYDVHGRMSKARLKLAPNKNGIIPVCL